MVSGWVVRIGVGEDRVKEDGVKNRVGVGDAGGGW